MAKKLMKGSEAIGEAAVQAGCKLFFGYPITPQNEIPEYMSMRLPQIGGAPRNLGVERLQQLTRRPGAPRRRRRHRRGDHALPRAPRGGARTDRGARGDLGDRPVERR